MATPFLCTLDEIEGTDLALVGGKAFRLALLKQYDIRKQEIFDLQLVSTILSNNINRIYTYNREHFLKFSELEVLIPE